MKPSKPAGRRPCLAMKSGFGFGARGNGDPVNSMAVV